MLQICCLNSRAEVSQQVSPWMFRLSADFLFGLARQLEQELQGKSCTQVICNH